MFLKLAAATGKIQKKGKKSENNICPFRVNLASVFLVILLNVFHQHIICCSQFRESYGEDIVDTETERSANGSVEDEYEDSFINDDEDPEIMSPSTVYSSEGNL